MNQKPYGATVITPADRAAFAHIETPLTPEAYRLHLMVRIQAAKADGFHMLALGLENMLRAHLAKKKP